MPSSDASSSSSSVQIAGSRSPGGKYRAAGHHDATAALSWPFAERLPSSLRTQEAVDALCEKLCVPREFTARPAGDRRACTPPPPGAVCVYAHSLQAGMRVPLHDFFLEALLHYDLAPSQFAPNGWRVLAGFLVLCHDAGVQPSVAFFRYFFSLSVSKYAGWCCFRCKADTGPLFTRVPDNHKGWKQEFFFLSSSSPWPCRVRWGELPSKSATADPVLTAEEKKSVAKLLGVHGAAVDLRTYLSETNLAAAFSSAFTGASLPPPPSPRTTGAKGMDPSVYSMMQSMRAAKEMVKTETDGDTPPLSGKKRKKEEANAEKGLCRSELSTPPSGHGCAVSGLGAPPGFSEWKTATSDQDRKPDRHDGDTAEWEAAREMLKCIVTPSRARLFAAAKPSDVVASTYISVLQAANYASFCLDYTVELEEKLAAQERDAAAEAGALREELEKAKAELADAKAGASAELEKAKAAAVREYLGSEEHVQRLAERALEGYERGMEDMRRVALRRYPHLDAARLVVPPGGPD